MLSAKLHMIASASRLPLFLACLAIPLLAQGPGAIGFGPEIDMQGQWAPSPHEESLFNPELGDYLGVPMNAAAFEWAKAWDPSRVTLPEHQCQVHVSPYIYGGPLNLRVQEKRDQNQRLVAIYHWISNWEQERYIWMDGRPHPGPDVPHTWMGFSTGTWEGNALTVYTTHIKQGWFRRNGIPESDQATLVEHFMLHDNLMTHVSVVTDPIYLTEPYYRTQVFIRYTKGGQNWLYPCEYVDEIANRPQGVVPHFLPGENPFLAEFPDKIGIPREAIFAGAESMYPDFQKKLKLPAAKR